MTRAIAWCAVLAILIGASTPAVAQSVNSTTANSAPANTVAPQVASDAATNVATTAGTNTLSSSAMEAAAKPLGQTGAWILIALVAVSTLTGLLSIRAALAKSPGWSLGDAVSEEADLTTATGTPIKQLRASSSRLIALAGLVVILGLFFGFGLVVMYDLAAGAALPSNLGDIERFLLAGLTLFAPYAINQVRTAMDGLTATAAPPPAPPATGQAAGATAPPPPTAAAPVGGC